MHPEDKKRFIINNNVITITGVKSSDSGMYQCGAINRYGARYSTAQLRILCKFCEFYAGYSRFQKPDSIADFAPTFAKGGGLFPNTYAAEMGSVTLHCDPEAAPGSYKGQKLTKEWYKNNRAIQGQDAESAKVRLLPNGEDFAESC